MANKKPSGNLKDNKFEALATLSSPPDSASSATSSIASSSSTASLASNASAATTPNNRSLAGQKATPSGYQHRFKPTSKPFIARSRSVMSSKTWQNRAENYNTHANYRPRANSGDFNKNIKNEEEEDADSNSVIKYPAACIFVASLVNGIPHNEHKDALQTLFLKICGSMPSIKVLKDNKNRPYAFVQFDTVEEAKTALKRAHGFILNKRPLRCERARVNRTIFISPKSQVTPEETKAAAEAFGTVEEFIEARTTNLPNIQEFEANEWFVKYVLRQDAVTAFNDDEFNSKWHITWCQNVDPMLDLNKLDSRSICIKNLSSDIKQHQIHEQFSHYGHIRDISTASILSGNKKIVNVYIKFEHELNAREATLQENGKFLGNYKLEVEHRLVVVSFEGDDAIKTPDPRVPSAAPPNTNNNTFKGHYLNYRPRAQGSNGNAVLSNAPHPRSFSANQFYSPTPQMFNNYAMTSNGYDAMNYYNSMYNPGKGYGNNYAHFGYYGPLGAHHGSQASHGSGGNYSLGSGSTGGASAGLSGGTSATTSPSTGGTTNSATLSNGMATAATSATSGGSSKEMNYYFDGGYARFYPRHGSTIPMMNPYGVMMYSPAYYSAVANNGKGQQQAKGNGYSGVYEVPAAGRK